MRDLEDLTAATTHERMEHHGLNRLLLLSDAVFAIAITLAALEIKPRDPWRTAPELWFALRLPLAAYLLSFGVIAIYWAAHRDTFARLRRVDTPLTVVSLLLLLFIAVLPAATQLLYEEGNAAGVQVYAVAVAACGFSQAAIWAYAVFRPGLMAEASPAAYGWTRLAASLVIPLFFSWLALIGAATLGPLAIYGAAFAVLVLLALRLFVLPRLATDTRA